MIDGARRKGVRLGTVSQRRWYWLVQRVKDAIASGKIGRPVLGTVYMLGWRDRKYYSAAAAWAASW